MNARRNILELFALLAIALAVMVLAQDRQARAEQQAPTEAERHEAARQWSAQRACGPRMAVVWIDSVRHECLPEAP